MPRLIISIVENLSTRGGGFDRTVSDRTHLLFDEDMIRYVEHATKTGISREFGLIDTGSLLAR
ncbi:hypothetical protein GCM10008992_21440 [Halorubrum aquaticum]